MKKTTAYCGKTSHLKLCTIKIIDMTVYVLTGMYRDEHHEVWGVYFSNQKAEEARDALMSRHGYRVQSWDIEPFIINNPVKAAQL